MCPITINQIKNDILKIRLSNTLTDGMRCMMVGVKGYDVSIRKLIYNIYLRKEPT